MKCQTRFSGINISKCLLNFYPACKSLFSLKEVVLVVTAAIELPVATEWVFGLPFLDNQIYSYNSSRWHSKFFSYICLTHCRLNELPTLYIGRF